MIHITNGDSAAGGIRAAGLPGEVLPWRDVLHDGPVPGDISFNQLRAVRARFIADCGWGTFEDALRDFSDRDRALDKSLNHEEIVLWFEHDLYDQLQLLQLLDWFATCELGATKLSMICNAEYLGPLSPEQLKERFPTRAPVGDAQIELAQRLWAAFRATDPTAIERELATDTSALPFVGAALRRHLEQFPSTVNGLSRTEHEAMQLLRGGGATASTAFRATQDREEAYFLGDLGFATNLAALSTCTRPLVRTASGDALRAPTAGPGPVFWGTEIRQTELGEAVSAGAADHIRLNGIDRWYGGVHLQSGTAVWRWDTAAKRLVISD